MQHIGSTESLKQAIAARYKEDIKSLHDKTRSKIDAMSKRKKLLYSNMKTMIDEQAKNSEKDVKTKTITALIMESRNSFEEERKMYLDKALDIVRSKLKELALDPKYISWIRSDMPKDKGLIAYAHSKEYSKHFSDMKIEIDESIIGIKFSKDNVNFDFSLTSIFESKKDMLKQEINKQLFGEIDV